MLFSSAFPGMYGTFLKYRFQRTYDAFLAAPVDVEEIVSAEVLWIGMRAGVYGNAPLLVAIAFGLDPKPTALLVPLICFVTGCAFVAFGVAIAGTAKSIDNFSYITSGVLTPMFLTAGTFFPISSFPPAIEAIAQVNPLYHCVQLVRDAVVVGIDPLADLCTSRCCSRSGSSCGALGDPPAAQAADRLMAACRALLRRRRLAVCVAGGGAGGAVLGSEVVWEPVLLGAIFAARGFGSWALTDARAAGIEEVERRAARVRPAGRCAGPSRGRATRCWRCGPRWLPPTPASARAFLLAALRLGFGDGRDLWTRRRWRTPRLRRASRGRRCWRPRRRRR